MRKSTARDYTKLDWEEVKDLLIPMRRFSSIGRNTPSLKSRIIELTCFFDSHYGEGVISLGQRCRAIIDDMKTIEDIPICQMCDGGNIVMAVKGNNGTVLSETCSIACSGRLSKIKGRAAIAANPLYDCPDGEIARSEYFRNAQKATNLKKRGVEHHSKCKDVIENRKGTCRTRFGGNSPMSSPEVREKVAASVEEKHGNSVFFFTDTFKEQTAATNVTEYGDAVYVKTSDFREKCQRKRDLENDGRHHTQLHIDDKSFEILSSPEKLQEMYDKFGGVVTAVKLGVDGTVVYDRLKLYGIDTGKKMSFAEEAIRDFVSGLGFDVESGNRTILQGKEIDIFVPSLNIGIEFNGVFWHSTPRVDKNYHLNKTELALESGVKLIHIWEDEWRDRQEHVKSKLASIMGVDFRPKVHARACVVSELSDRGAVRAFMNDNHIQGAAGFSYALGLSFNGHMVAVMTFKKVDDETITLNRFATSHRVVGGFSKLFAGAKNKLRDFGFRKVVTFADRRFGEGDMYKNTGWELEKVIPPDYQYVIGTKTGPIRKRKQGFRRDRLVDFLDNFDPELSEVVNMNNHGFYQLFDCGLNRFVYSI